MSSNNSTTNNKLEEIHGNEISRGDNFNNELINEDDYNVEYEFNKKYGLCPKCNQLNTHRNWCKECNSKRFQQNFSNWTSGNEHIDKFIQEAQLNARGPFELIEWIPYNQLRNIKYLTQGGFSTV